MGLTSMSRGDGKIKVSVTPSDDDEGFLNVHMQWPFETAGEPNIALMTIGPKDAAVLIEKLIPWVRRLNTRL